MSRAGHRYPVEARLMEGNGTMSVMTIIFPFGIVLTIVSSRYIESFGANLHKREEKGGKGKDEE